MLFWDGVKIDLTLLPLEVLDEYFTWELQKIIKDIGGNFGIKQIKKEITSNL